MTGDNGITPGSVTPDPSDGESATPPSAPSAPPPPIDTPTRPGWWPRLSGHWSSTGVWQALVALAIAATFAIAWQKLPDPAPTGAGNTPAPRPTGSPPDDVGNSSAGVPAEVQRELALARIADYLKKQGLDDAARADPGALDKVLAPLVKMGLVKQSIATDVVERVIGKDGWIEGLASYGGDLLKEYLKGKWAARDKGGSSVDGDGRGITVTCSPVIKVVPPSRAVEWRSTKTTVVRPGPRSPTPHPSSGSSAPQSCARSSPKP